ncbi:MAG: hypothetical protein WC595_06680, partial [Candidatus Nanoarchaeia archaeon]
RDALVKRRSDLDKLVEKPLLGACQILYDKNIKTLESTANKNNISSGASIVLDYNSLSNENKVITNKYFGHKKSTDGILVAEILIPITSPEKTVKEISDSAINEANKFKSQPLRWGVLNFKQILKFYGVDENKNLKPEDFTQDFFYDSDSQLFFLSEEHCIKVVSSMSKRDFLGFVISTKLKKV